MTAQQQRRGARDSKVRAQILEVAIGIVEQEGCNALTMGRLAKAVGLTRPAVHYYFGTIEDIFVEILRKQQEEVRKRTASSFENIDNPLRSIWNFKRATNPLSLEFQAMAIRSDRIRQEMSRSMEELFTITTSSIEKFVEERNLSLPIPVEALTAILRSLSYSVAMGRVLGSEVGHKELIKTVEDFISKIELEWKLAKPDEVNG